MQKARNWKRVSSRMLGRRDEKECKNQYKEIVRETLGKLPKPNPRCWDVDSGIQPCFPHADQPSSSRVGPTEPPDPRPRGQPINPHVLGLPYSHLLGSSSYGHLLGYHHPPTSSGLSYMAWSSGFSGQQSSGLSGHMVGSSSGGFGPSMGGSSGVSGPYMAGSSGLSGLAFRPPEAFDPTTTYSSPHGQPHLVVGSSSGSSGPSMGGSSVVSGPFSGLAFRPFVPPEGFDHTTAHSSHHMMPHSYVQGLPHLVVGSSSAFHGSSFHPAPEGTYPPQPTHQRPRMTPPVEKDLLSLFGKGKEKEKMDDK